MFSKKSSAAKFLLTLAQVFSIANSNESCEYVSTIKYYDGYPCYMDDLKLSYDKGNMMMVMENTASDDTNPYQISMFLSQYCKKQDVGRSQVSYIAHTHIPSYGSYNNNGIGFTNYDNEYLELNPGELISLSSCYHIADENGKAQVLNSTLSLPGDDLKITNFEAMRIEGKDETSSEQYKLISGDISASVSGFFSETSSHSIAIETSSKTRFFNKQSDDASVSSSSESLDYDSPLSLS